MGIVFLDTETTGFVPGQICELTMIHETDNHEVIPYNYFFTVDEMNKEAESIHGFSQEKLIELSNGKRFGDYKSELLDILCNNTLVAHNESFDEKFLSSEFWRLGISFKPTGRLDTMSYFKDILKIPAKTRRFGPYKNPKLSEVLNYLKINTYEVQQSTQKLFGGNKTDFHDSRFDTTAMYIAVNVYREILHGGFEWRAKFCN